MPSLSTIRTRSPQSRAYLEAFRGSRYFEEHALNCSADELHKRLQRSEIKIALEIPPGFGRDLYAGRQPTVAAWLDGGMPFRAETSRSYVQAVHQANLAQLATLSSLAQNRQAAAAAWKPVFYNQDVISVKRHRSGRDGADSRVYPGHADRTGYRA